MSMKTTRISLFSFLVLGLAGAAFAGDLAEGSAQGDLTVNGKTVALTHAYAIVEPDSFDETKDSILLLMTDEALPEAEVAKGNISAYGLVNYLQLEFRESESADSPFNFHGTWKIGHRLVGHEVLGDMTLQSSPDFDSKAENVVALDKERIEATITTGGEVESLGNKFSYAISVNVKVAPRQN